MKKEYPIIFTAESVRAILSGRKWQTRRVMKPQPYIIDRHRSFWYPNIDHKKARSYANEHHYRKGVVSDFAPYRNGDRLWVREKWRPCRDEELWDVVRYEADHKVMKPTITDENIGMRFSEDCDRSALRASWRSPMFMPRWASRITLEVTEVRAQQVQDITLSECAAEGAPPTRPDDGVWDSNDTFRDMWDSINAKRGYPWSDNPWVWTISFFHAIEDKTCY